MMTLNMFFAPFESSEVVIVNMFLADLTLMCIYQNQCQYLSPQKTSFYCGFINQEFGLVCIAKTIKSDSKSFVNNFRINIKYCLRIKV